MMDELLLSIQRHLRGQMADFRASDIYITPDLQYLPQGVKMPCIGIKDGKVEHKYLAAGEKEYVLFVRLIVFLELTKRREAIVGGNFSLGILQITRQLTDLLENNPLGDPEIQEARIIEDPESKFYLGKGKEMYQRKELVLKYTKITGF